MKQLNWLILCCGTILAISMGIRQSFGLYLAPLSADLGLNREIFSLSMAFVNLVWGLGAPLAGALTDRYGPRFVILFGSLTYAIGLYLMSSASTSSDIVTAGVIIGLGIAGTGFTAILGAASRAVSPDKRSVTLGLVSMGGSIGQFAALPVAHQLIADFGWVQSLLLLAIAATFMALLGFSIASSTVANNEDDKEESWNTALMSAMSHKGFLLLIAGFSVCGFHVAFVAIHLPAFLQDKGYAVVTGTMALTLIGLGNIVGTYFFGWLGQRIEQRIALSALYLARAAIFVPFLFLPLSEPIIWLLSATLGFLWLGTIPLTSGLVAALFGPRWMSMLFGIVFLSHQVGAFLGAWLGGRIYDQLGSYDAMWWISILLGVTAAILHWPIKVEPAPSLSPATTR